LLVQRQSVPLHIVGDTNIYIDGLNFYYGAVKGTPFKWFDFEAFSRLLVPLDTIGKIRYFTARVKPRHTADRCHERQNAFLRAIDANPLIEITEGHFRKDVRWRALAEEKHECADLFRPELLPAEDAKALLVDARSRREDDPWTSARVLIPEEKGSDVNLAAYLLRDAFKGKCAKAIVVTNDSDLAKPIAFAVQEGIEVGIVNPHYKNSTNHRLLDVATFEIPLREATLDQCQLPTPVIGRGGRQIHKPKEW